MIKVGIVVAHKQNEQIYEDYFKINSIYLNKIKEVGGVPVLLTDDSLLDICDAFIIPGGSKIDILCYQVINYAVIKNTPLLGICMGMQAMCLYDLILSRVGEFDTDLFSKEYKKLKEDKFMFLKEITDNSHGGTFTSSNNNVTNEDLFNSKHDIKIETNSYLFDIYKSNILSVNTMHKYYYDLELNYFDKVAFAGNILEGIEYKDKTKFIIGVQFHPELMNTLIFEYLIKEAEGRL